MLSPGMRDNQAVIASTPLATDMRASQPYWLMDRWSFDTSTPYTASLWSMMSLARLKDAGVGVSRCVALLYRRSRPHDPLSTLARGRGSLSRSVHLAMAER